MRFFAFGFNHESAPVSVREVFALDSSDIRAFYREVRLSSEAEVLILSTCNRTEVFLYGQLRDIVSTQTRLGQQVGHVWPSDVSFFMEDEAAIKHLLQVTCGLRSLVLGESQILSQVKDAYRLAVEEERVGSVLHRLLHTAFRTAKRVINETNLSQGNVSVSSAAVATAKHFLQSESSLDPDQATVLVLGAGEMAKLAVEALAANGFSSIQLSNRTKYKADELSKSFGIVCVDWGQKSQAIQGANVVIAATSSTKPIVLPTDVEVISCTEERRLFIDLSVPRNIHPLIGEVDRCTYIDLDHLNTRLVHSEQIRRASVPTALEICDESLNEYVAWVFHQQALEPAISAIRETFESIRQQEIEKHAHRFSEVDREELNLLTSSIIQKLLAIPVVRLKSVNPESIDFVNGIKLLEALFSRPMCEDESVVGSPGLQEHMESNTSLAPLDALELYRALNVSSQSTRD